MEDYVIKVANTGPREATVKPLILCTVNLGGSQNVYKEMPHLFI